MWKMGGGGKRGGGGGGGGEKEEGGKGCGISILGRRHSDNIEKSQTLCLSLLRQPNNFSFKMLLREVFTYTSFGFRLFDYAMPYPLVPTHYPSDVSSLFLCVVEHPAAESE